MAGGTKTFDLDPVGRSFDPTCGTENSCEGHAYLHVSEVWNGHNSHFRDVTPTKAKQKKEMLISRGEKI